MSNTTSRFDPATGKTTYMKRVDTSTLAGLRRAEKLHSEGWATYSTTHWSTVFTRTIVAPVKTAKKAKA